MPFLMDSNDDGSTTEKGTSSSDEEYSRFRLFIDWIYDLDLCKQQYWNIEWSLLISLELV